MPALLDLQSLSAKERHGVRSFRVAAKKLDSIVRPHYTRSFLVRFARPDKDDEAELIPPLEFESAVAALRLVYLRKEAANFQEVLKIARGG